MITTIRRVDADEWFVGWTGKAAISAPVFASDELDPLVQVWDRHDPDYDEEKDARRDIETTVAFLLDAGYDCEAVTQFV